MSFFRNIASFYYQFRLKHLGENSNIDLRANIEGYLKNISLGNNVVIGKNATLHCDEPTAGIHVGNNTTICPSAMILTYKGNIKIGNYCSVNPFCVLYGLGGLIIGDHVRIATQTVIVPANHVFENRDIPIARQGLTKQGIVIEDDVWVGAGVKILDGCVIGKGSVLGAGTVLTKSVEPYSVVAGVPGRIIRRRGE